MISIKLGRLRWLHLYNPFDLSNWKINIRLKMWEILFICLEGY